MPTQRFKTIVLKNNKGIVYIEIPFDPNKIFGKNLRHYVSGTINGITFSGSLIVGASAYHFQIKEALQTRANIIPGKSADIVLTSGKGNEIDLPIDIQTALEENKEAKEFFNSINKPDKENYVKWINSAEEEFTRKKRIEETINLLTVGRKHK